MKMAFSFSMSSCFCAAMARKAHKTASNRLFPLNFLHYRSRETGSFFGKWSFCLSATQCRFTRREQGCFMHGQDAVRNVSTSFLTKPSIFTTTVNMSTCCQSHQRSFPLANYTNNYEVKSKLWNNRDITYSCHRCYCEQSKTHSKDDATAKSLDHILTVPNVLTITRMVLAPVLGYLVLQESFSMACGVFIVAGSTDLLDGTIARRYPSQISALGSFIDPLADKLLVSVLYITLTMVKLIPLWLAALVIARDVLLLASGFYVRYISLPPPKTFSRFFDITNVTAQLKPMFISKVNTALQLGLVSLTLAAPVFSFIDHSYLHLLWYLTACTTCCSGLGYIFAKDTFKVFQQSKKKKV